MSGIMVHAVPLICDLKLMCWNLNVEQYLHAVQYVERIADAGKGGEVIKLDMTVTKQTINQSGAVFLISLRMDQHGADVVF